MITEVPPSRAMTKEELEALPEFTEPASWAQLDKKDGGAVADVAQDVDSSPADAEAEPVIDKARRQGFGARVMERVRGFWNGPESAQSKEIRRRNAIGMRHMMVVSPDRNGPKQKGMWLKGEDYDPSRNV